LLNQTQRDTPLFEALCGEVTITDPTHPLYGQTFPRLTVRVNRSKTHVTVLLPTGRRRSVPRSATDLQHPVEEVSHDLPLPAISVRTILPLARLVHQLKQAKEESHAEQATSIIHPTEQCSPSSPDPSSIGFRRAATCLWRTWSPNSFSGCAQAHKTRSVTMNAEMMHITPTTEHRAKMAYVYIRQSSLMQVTRHAESTDLQYSLVERAVAASVAT
jgi:hypothetical protein